MTRRWTRLAAAALLPCISLLCGCEGEGVPLGVACGPLEQFPPVSLVLERRCGTLDCHGHEARPLKIYSAGGLRLVDAKTGVQLLEELPTAIEEGRTSGGVSTTDAEFEANWRAACALEPEKTSLVVTRELDPRELMLLRKPLLGERHKGGQLFQEGDAGETCISCWLRGFPEDLVECQDALQGCADAIQNQL